jgi:hypothetical protein
MIAWTHAEDRLLWHLAEEETSWREKANLFVDRSHKSLKQRWGRIRDLPLKFVQRLAHARVTAAAMHAWLRCCMPCTHACTS